MGQVTCAALWTFSTVYSILKNIVFLKTDTSVIDNFTILLTLTDSIEVRSSGDAGTVLKAILDCRGSECVILAEYATIL